MSDVNISDNTNLVVLTSRQPGHSTGPVTPEGKAKVSNNAATHGCTSSLSVVDGKLTPQAEARIVLPNENPADWEAMKRMWFLNYEATTDLHLTLILSGAVADWIKQRSIRRYYEIEHYLFKQTAIYAEWTADQHQLLEKFGRYLARAERSYARARNAVEQLRREHKRDAEKEAAPKVLPAKTPGNTSRAEVQPETQIATTRHESALIQCVTIQVIDGEAYSLFQPKNQFLKQMILNSAEPKPTIKRALYFLDEVPAEYAWIPEFESHQDRPHFVITRTAEEALNDLEREMKEGAIHVLPLR